MPPYVKPTKIPEWATGDNAAIVEPMAGEKATGWLIGQAPPAPYFNWLMGGDVGYTPWLQYVSTFEQNALTWPERQTFQSGFAASGTRSTIAGLDVTAGQTVTGGLDVTGGVELDSITSATGTGLLATPLLALPSAGARYQIARHVVNVSPLRYGRTYATPTGFVHTVNAGWNDATSLWVADDVASPAIIFRLEGSAFRIGRVDSPAAPFTDAAFTDRIVADSTTGARGQALGYSDATGVATFSNAIRSASVLAGTTDFPWFTPGVWTTGNATAWTDATGCGNLTGQISANNATIQGETSITIATLPSAMWPASGAEAHGAGYYLPPSGTTWTPVRVSVDSSGIVTLFYVPSNGLVGTAVILLPCLHWRLTTG